MLLEWLNYYLADLGGLVDLAEGDGITFQCIRNHNGKI